MIYYVSGSVSILEPGLAVIDCGGVGYGCRISAYTSAQPKPRRTALRRHTSTATSCRA